jgi:hypothetical protein
MRWNVVVVLGLVVVACGPAVNPAQDLVLTARPKTILDDGKEETDITISASDTKGEAGKGTVRLSAPAGTLSAGVELKLDADGMASTDFACGFLEDPNCKGTVELKAVWSQGGKTVEGTVVVTIKADPLRGACSPSRQRVLTEVPGGAATDIRLALSSDFKESTQLALAGADVGVTFFNPVDQVGGFAVNIDQTGNTAIEDEAAARVRLAKLGVISNPLVQAFTSWDGYFAARATYDMDGADNLKDRINAIAREFSDAAVDGLLGGSATVAGPFKVTVTYVRRKGKTTVVLAMTNDGGNVERKNAIMDDAAGGIALAQLGDTTTVQCETVVVKADQKIDFLWVVDDSCSMASSQDAVATAGSLFGSRLARAGLNWRAAAVTTGYYPTSFGGSFRDWTTDVTAMKNWFLGSSGVSFGTGGSGTECGYSGTQTFLDQLLPSGSTTKPTAFRKDAQAHIIFLTDTEEQCGIEPAAFLSFVRAKLPNQRLVVHGIICPEGGSCGDAPETNGYYHKSIRETGGVLGSIMVFNPATPTTAEKNQQSSTINAIVGSAVGAAGQTLAAPPTPGSIRVAMSGSRGTCNLADVPHDRQSGWDLDPTTGKVVFYGGCIPVAGATVIVSYQSWNDATPP